MIGCDKMKFKGIKRRIAFFIVNRLLKGTNKRLFETKRRLLNWCGIKVDVGSKIVGPIYITGNLEIGKNTWIGKNFTINGNGCVYIGSNCDIAPDVMFVTGGHEIGNSTRRAGIGFNKDIKVGSGTLIGARVTILGGINIG